MGRYNKYESQGQGPAHPKKVHPIWQGIGCLLLILIPIMSYAGAVILVNENLSRHWVPAPALLLQTVYIPVVGIAVPHLFANLVTGALLALLGFGFVTILYSLLYGAIGPSRFGPLDARPDEYRSHKRRR